MRKDEIEVGDVRHISMGMGADKDDRSYIEGREVCSSGCSLSKVQISPSQNYPSQQHVLKIINVLTIVD